MVVRGATPEDSGAIAEIHVRSWRAAYRGIVPPEFLDSISVEQREGAWRQRLERGTSGTSVLEEQGEVLGWVSAGSSRDADALPSTSELWAIYGLEGRERLRVLARVMHASSMSLFDRLGLSDGLACLDVGCGGGDATLELARRVGPRGTVVGVDIDRT